MSKTEIAPKLKEIADRIHAHLKRIESQQSKDVKSGLFNANAFDAGSRVKICYLSYQGTSSLSKKDALDYFKWLDAGNTGRHWAVTGFNARIGA